MFTSWTVPWNYGSPCWLSSSLSFTLWSSWSEVKQSASSLFDVPHILLSASRPCIPPQHGGWSAQWSSERGQIQTELAERTAEADETSYLLKDSLCVVTHTHTQVHTHTRTQPYVCFQPESGVHSLMSTVFKPRVVGSRLDKDDFFPVCWKIECITLRIFIPFRTEPANTTCALKQSCTFGGCWLFIFT